MSDSDSGEIGTPTPYGRWDYSGDIRNWVPDDPSQAVKGRAATAYDPSLVAYTARPNYEGTPTEYYDKSGNMIAFLGRDNIPISTSSLNFVDPTGKPLGSVADRSAMIQSTDAAGNLLWIDPNDENRQTLKNTGIPATWAPLASQIKMNEPQNQSLFADPLFRNFMLSAGAMAGAAALAPAASGAAGATEAGAAGAGGWEGSSAIMNSVAQGSAPLASGAAGAGTAGLTAAEALQYGKMGLSGLSAAKSLAGLAGVGGGGGGSGDSGIGLSNLIAPAAAAALAAGLAKTDSSGNVTAPGLQSAPPVPKFNWNYQAPDQSDPYIARGQQMLNPQYLAKGGLTNAASIGADTFYKAAKDAGLPTNIDSLNKLVDLVNQGMTVDEAAASLATKQNFAKGGLPALPQEPSKGISSLGGYSDGGRMLKGPGDGMSDSIPASIENKRPARLATDEFVVPADVVSHLGNGSSDAGAKVLYAMMDRVRKARTGNKKQGKQINPHKFMPT